MKALFFTALVLLNIPPCSAQPIKPCSILIEAEESEETNFQSWFPRMTRNYLVQKGWIVIFGDQNPAYNIFLKASVEYKKDQVDPVFIYSAICLKGYAIRNSDSKASFIFVRGLGFSQSKETAELIAALDVLDKLGNCLKWIEKASQPQKVLPKKRFDQVFAAR